MLYVELFYNSNEVALILALKDSDEVVRGYTPHDWRFVIHDPSGGTVIDVVGSEFNSGTSGSFNPGLTEDSGDLSFSGWTRDEDDDDWQRHVDREALSDTGMRCDNTAYSFPGCINPRVYPEFTGINHNFPEIRQHVLDAISEGAPSVLRRTRDESRIRLNRSRACPSSIVRPDGKECDEYPFASTMEGGSRLGRIVDAKQNGDAGKALLWFYNWNRIRDGEEYRVVVY